MGVSKRLVAMIRPAKPISEMSEEEIDALAERVFEALARSAGNSESERSPTEPEA